MSGIDVDASSVHYHPQYGAERRPGERSIVGNRPIALYIHIPFCATRCHFCTFAIVTGKSIKDELVESYLKALKKEISFYARQLQEQRILIETIQIGGGTPTMLDAQQLKNLLSFLFDTFDTSALLEIIVEGFPTTITVDKVDVLAQFNQLKFNIGIQTFSDQNLDEAGRRHSLNDALNAVRTAKAAGIRSVGADIIFGLPFSSTKNVINDAATVAELGVDHLAFYPLWVYGDTAIGRKIRVGTLPPPDYQDLREQMFTGLARLEGHGYERYTAFHYAASAEHRHQYGLWQMRGQEWLGFGMAAMSYLDGHIYLNEGSIRAYIDKIERGIMNTGTVQTLGKADEMNFAFLYGVRLREYPFSLFEAKFHQHPGEVYYDELRSLHDRGLITYDDSHVALTPDGILGLGKIEELINSRVSMVA
jgi:oxygen-independent coproporphyrinogen-3 oxidase